VEHRIPHRGTPDTAPWNTGYRTVEHRIPHRGTPDTAPWNTGYRTVEHRNIFIFLLNQKVSAHFSSLKGFKRLFKRYLKEKTRARRLPVDNF
jgi:hypothetical protein